MYLFFEVNEKFTADEIIHFADVLTRFETINDNELIELISRENITIYDISKHVEDISTKTEFYFCFRVARESIKQSYEIKKYYFLTKDIESLPDKYPQLAWKCLSKLESKNKKTEIHSLHEEIESLQKQKMDLTEQLKKCLRLHQTSGASNAKTKTTAESWSGYLDSAIRLALHCFNNEKAYTRDELKTLCTQEGYGQISQEALDTFCKAMDKKYIRQRGAPSRDSKPE